MPNLKNKNEVYFLCVRIADLITTSKSLLFTFVIFGTVFLLVETFFLGRNFWVILLLLRAIELHTFCQAVHVYTSLSFCKNGSAKAAFYLQYMACDKW